MPIAILDAVMNKSRKIIAIVPARYASTRFPGKPLVPILGKTLIQRTYENAQRCPLLDDLVVATDDQRIFDHVLDFGGKVVMTSSECATGTDRLAEVIRHNPQFDQADIIVNIQGDEPCLDPVITTKMIEALLGDAAAVMSTAVVPLRSEEEAIQSSINKCVIDLNGYALYFSRALIPAGRTLCFIPSNTYYRHVGIYAYRRSFLLKYAELPPTPLQLAEDLEQLKVLEHGYKIKTVIVDSISIGVDVPEDIKKVEQLLCKPNTSL